MYEEYFNLIFKMEFFKFFENLYFDLNCFDFLNRFLNRNFFNINFSYERKYLKINF